MIMLAIGFHYLQNSGAIKGGSVPAVKTAWLFTVLFYWYVLPAIYSADKSLPTMVRQLFAVVLINMIVRALVELPMMYVTQTWLHIYGIGHDIFSALLCLAIGLMLMSPGLLSVVLRSQVAKKQGTTLPGWLHGYFIFSAFLFLMEAVFANYLRNVTGADGKIFFLPMESSHGLMLSITAVVVATTWGVIIYQMRQWHEPRT